MPRPKNRGRDRSLIVGIGASAGGLEAFSQLLRELPVETGMAFVTAYARIEGYSAQAAVG